MNKSYEVLVSMTSKAIGSKEPYQLFERIVKSFSSLASCKDWVRDEYKLAKRTKMYVDCVNGAPKHIGFIYHFRNKDWSHNEPEYLQEDWVEVYEVKRTRVVLN